MGWLLGVLMVDASLNGGEQNLRQDTLRSRGSPPPYSSPVRYVLLLLTSDPLVTGVACRNVEGRRQDLIEEPVVLHEAWLPGHGWSLSVARLDVDKLGFIALEPIRSQDRVLHVEHVPAWQLGSEGVKVRTCA